MLSDKAQSSNKTQILIYKVFDNLISTYPGMANIYRKGIDREKLLTIFTRASKENLKDSTFYVENTDAPKGLPTVKEKVEKSKSPQRNFKLNTSGVTSKSDVSSVDLNSTFRSQTKKNTA